MAIIRPFRALRPVPEKAEKVACAPYDVVHETEVRLSIQENPLSFLRITRSEAEFPRDEMPSSKVVFERSRENLQTFIDKGIFFTENKPALYVYRLISNGHIQTGIVGCCSLDEYENGLIRKHEKTRPDKVKDRTEHLLAVRAQTGLVLLAFRVTEIIKGLIDAAVTGQPVELELRIAENKLGDLPPILGVHMHARVLVVRESSGDLGAEAVLQACDDLRWRHGDPLFASGGRGSCGRARLLPSRIVRPHSARQEPRPPARSSI